MQKYHYNISLLRPILCFGVVCVHFWNGDKSDMVNKLLACCAPVFFIISFFFFQNNFINDNIKRIKQRIIRLSVPQIGWAVVYFVMMNIVFIVRNPENIIPIKDMVGQILTGHFYNPTMWFQTDLIIITLLFYLINQVCKRRTLVFAIISCFIPLAFLSQYSGLNFSLFSQLKSTISYPLGRVCEMLPYAVIGLLFSAFYRKSEIKTVGLSWFFIVILLLSTKKIAMPSGFHYQGFYLFFISFFVFSTSFLIPFEKFPVKVLSIIKFVSRYTLGIYCSHRLIAFFLIRLFCFMGLERMVNTVFYCILIYLVGFSIFYLMDKFINIKYFRLMYD